MKRLLMLMLVMASSAFAMKTDYSNHAKTKKTHNIEISAGMMSDIRICRDEHKDSGPLCVLSEERPRRSYFPYVKIALGTGFTLLSAYLGLKAATSSSQPITYHHGEHSTAMFVANVNINAGSIATIAPIIPGYFLIKSGCKDLAREKKELLKRVRAKENHNRSLLPQMPAPSAPPLSTVPATFGVSQNQNTPS